MTWVNGPWLTQIVKLLLGIVVLIKTGTAHQVILFLLWQTFLMPSLKKHGFNISRDILYLAFYEFSCKSYNVITFLICIIQKRQYTVPLKWKKIFQKWKQHSYFVWKAFQKSSKYFSFNMHFKQSLANSLLTKILLKLLNCPRATVMYKNMII